MMICECSCIAWSVKCGHSSYFLDIFDKLKSIIHILPQVLHLLWCALQDGLEDKSKKSWESRMIEEMELMDVDPDLLKEAELNEEKNWRSWNEYEGLVSPTPEELHVLMQTRWGDYCWKGKIILLYGSYYWNNICYYKKLWKDKWLQVIDIIKPNNLQSLQNLRYNFYHANEGVKVEHVNKLLDYQPLMYVVNQCEETHLWW